LPPPASIAPDLVMLAAPETEYRGILYRCADKKFAMPAKPATVG
jgi:hypothetical protein